MMRIGPVTRLLAKPALSRLALLLSLVVAIFMAESFTSLLEEALRNDGGSVDVIWLLLLEAPEIVDLALAIGVLIAVYFSVLDARNHGELVILATTGVRWTQVVGFALCLGVFGGALSIAVAGYVIPKARYAERIAIAKLKADHVIQQVTVPGPRNARQTILDTTFIATPPTSLEQERGQLFVYQPGENGTWRVGQSRDWSVEGPDDDGQHRITLHNLRAYSGVFSTASPVPVSVFNVADAGLEFRMSDVAKVPDRALKEKERLLTFTSKSGRKLGSVGARALLVPAAALLALAAILASGAGITRFFALPAAAVLLLVFDVLGQTLITDASLFTSPPILVVLSVTAFLLPPLMFILWYGEGLMKPARTER